MPGPTALMTTPMTAPAKANPAQGNSVKLVLPGDGRKYHSIGSGSQLRAGVTLTIGVASETITAQAPNSTALRHWLAALVPTMRPSQSTAP